MEAKKKVAQNAVTVQIHDEGHRLLWSLCRVVELHEGKDNHVRSVKPETHCGTVSRPVTLYYPLERRVRDHVESFPKLLGEDLSSPHHESRGRKY